IAIGSHVIDLEVVDRKHEDVRRLALRPPGAPGASHQDAPPAPTGTQARPGSYGTAGHQASSAEGGVGEPVADEEDEEGRSGRASERLVDDRENEPYLSECQDGCGPCGDRQQATKGGGAVRGLRAARRR